MQPLRYFVDASTGTYQYVSDITSIPASMASIRDNNAVLNPAAILPSKKTAVLCPHQQLHKVQDREA